MKIGRAGLLRFSHPMILDAKTTVDQLVNALPSSRAVLQAYGLSLHDLGDQPLWEVITDRHIPLDDFLDDLDEIDWSVEFPSNPE